MVLRRVGWFRDGSERVGREKEKGYEDHGAVKEERYRGRKGWRMR